MYNKKFIIKPLNDIFQYRNNQIRIAIVWELDYELVYLKTLQDNSIPESKVNCKVIA